MFLFESCFGFVCLKAFDRLVSTILAEFDVEKLLKG